MENNILSYFTWDEDRREVLSLLSKGLKNLEEIKEKTKMEKGLLNYQIGVLKQLELIEEKDGKYRITEQGREVANWVEARYQTDI